MPPLCLVRRSYVIQLPLLVQATLFAAEGVTKIRLTGGEPTIRKDIVQLTAELAAVAGVQSVGITTNGIALQRKLAALKANGATPILGCGPPFDLRSSSIIFGLSES